MKKIIALMLAMLMLVALVSCDDKKRDSRTSDTDEDVVTDSFLEEKNEALLDEDKRTEDKKTEDKRTEDKKTEDKKTEDRKTEDKKTDDKKTDEKVSSNKNIKDYVDKNKSALLSAMESSFATSSGMTCTSDIKVDGFGFVIYININELSNVDDATKDQLQQVYDGMDSYFETLLTTMQQELPELEYYKIIVGDKNGDALATIHAGK